MVSNDTIKADLVKQYFSFASKEFEIITYFAMYDGDGGWGLLNLDGSIRLSGLSASQWLITREGCPPNCPGRMDMSVFGAHRVDETVALRILWDLIDGPAIDVRR